MGSMVIGGFDVVGDDEDEDDFYVGAAKPRRGAAALARHAGKVVVPTPRWMNSTTSQGVSRPQEEMDFLPFTPVTILVGASTGTLNSRPQRPFRGERLILGALNITAGTDASNNATINPAIFVGAVQVGAAQGGTPFSAFRADAFGVRLSFPSAGQGTDINIFSILLAVAPAGGVALTGTVIGRSMR